LGIAIVASYECTGSSSNGEALDTDIDVASIDGDTDADADADTDLEPAL
jgi:hypothetical protein